MSYEPSDKEKSILGFITENLDVTFREIAQAVGTDENTARRLYNRLFRENVCSKVIIPNYAMLGYKVMMIQRIHVKSSALPDIREMKSRILDEWDGCTDCFETFDGKLYVRSVWKDADEFKRARTLFHQRHGSDWIESEDVDMVPLDAAGGMINVRSLWRYGEDTAS